VGWGGGINADGRRRWTRTPSWRFAYTPYEPKRGASSARVRVSTETRGVCVRRRNDGAERSGAARYRGGWGVEEEKEETEEDGRRNTSAPKSRSGRRI